MTHVFVSYSRKDERFVLPLAGEIDGQGRSFGVKTWVDQRDIKAGDDWDRRIDEAIARCSAFLIVLSPESVESRDVRAELNRAIELKKPLLPVMYRETRLPRRILEQFIDLTDDGAPIAGHAAAIIGRLSTLESAISGTQTPASYDSLRIRGHRHRLIVATHPGIAFGRTAQSSASLGVVPLRLRPCISPTATPENWRLSQKIGRRHLEIRLADGSVFLTCASRAGVHLPDLGGVRVIAESSMALSTRLSDPNQPRGEAHAYSLKMGERVEVVGDQDFILGSSTLSLRLIVLRDESGRITGVHIRRSDTSDLEYFLLVAPQGLALAPDGRFRFVGVHAADAIAVLDPQLRGDDVVQKPEAAETRAAGEIRFVNAIGDALPIEVEKIDVNELVRDDESREERS